MNSNYDKLKVSTPGRICLFGEHQDYLSLPVIACAISLRISISGKKRDDNIIYIDLPNIDSNIQFKLNETLNYKTDRDYFRSSINILQRQGYTFSTGYDCIVDSNIPISAGTASSSALVVTWVNFLTQMSDQHKLLSPNEIAKLSHQAEVLEFNEPGGMMDQYCTSLGGLLYIEFHPILTIQRLPNQLKTFVLGNSSEPKDTKYILSHVKTKVQNITKKIKRRHPKFSLLTVLTKDLDWYIKNLDKEEMSLIHGTLQNRDITREALKLFLQPQFDDKKFGDLLWEHQCILRDILKISTPKIDRLLDAALEAGAFGGKINGSGGGGCMFAYSPDSPEKVAEAIEKVGGKAYIVKIDDGTRVEQTK